LRHVLEQGVAALKPAAGVSQQSDAWRTHRVLHHRYIEQFDQNDVAGNLNLSIRQLRRQEGVALQSIADMLCERFGLKCVADPVDDESGSAAGDSATTAENELALAERTYPNRPTDLAPILDAVRDTIKPMADALGVVLGQIAKSVVFRRQGDDQAVLVIASGDRRVDEQRLAALVGPVGRADAQYVKSRTGFAIGGVSPVGLSGDATLLLDRELQRFAEIWAAAGHPNGVFMLSPQDLQRLTGAPWVDVVCP
jgi:prolyl-tRNA editing enzyme YbaK/EbsC (Cys-tRNA(Pro) deacylase)